MKTKIKLSGKYLIARQKTENLNKEYVHLSIISFESNSFRDQMEKFTDRFVKIMFVCKFIYLINRNEAHLNELRLNATYEIPF